MSGAIGHGISTPMGAYRWCRAIGLDHALAVRMTSRRDIFEYFAAAIGC